MADSSSSEGEDNLMTISTVFAEVDTKIRKRAVLKRKITLVTNSIKVDSSTESVQVAIDTIKANLSEVQVIDTSIVNDLLTECDGQEEVEARLEKEVNEQTSYEQTVRLTLKNLAKLVAPISSPSTSTGELRVKTHEFEVKLPPLKCSSFSGEGHSHLEYYSFITQFNNIVGSREKISNCTKFTYLKSYLTGYALKLIQHLQVSETNYSIALDLLRSEFLNKDAVVDSFIKRFLELKPKFDNSFLESKIYINEVRCILSDLKLNDVDVLSESSAKLIISHVVFNNLPTPFQRELISKLGTSYPSITQIFNTYADVVRTLNLKMSSSAVAGSSAKPSGDSVSRQKSIGRKSSANFANSQRTVCKFCGSNSHSMLHCERYSTLEQRKKRCAELKLCNLCTSSKHEHFNCKSKLDFACRFCDSHNHISALCFKAKRTASNVCINSSHGGGSHHLLPTLTVRVTKGDNSTEVRCLLDCGSQRTYFSSAVLDRIKYPSRRIEHNYSVNSFTSSGHKVLSEASLSIEYSTEISAIQLPVLIDKKFDLEFEVCKLGVAMSNFNSNSLADSQASTSTDTVKLEGILGTDSMQFLGGLKIVDCMGGSAFSLCNKLIPFGDIDHFLSRKQVSTSSNSNSLTLSDSTMVNFALNPCGIEFDPVHSVISDSQVEGHLERMFKIESLGLKEGKFELSNKDEKVDNFASNIVCTDNRYYVDLPWYENKLSKVNHNFVIARAVLDRVIDRLHKENLYDSYASVFEQQQADGVLEEVDLTSINFKEHVFIPHRPVIKMDSQVTTKVRPVLNCSLKRDGSLSLNEAAFPGIDLLHKLLGLLMKIRKNKFLVTADIKSAFLQIKLKTEKDKNLFTILFKDRNGDLKAFRYTTLVFGYTASPFILNYVIKHHLANFPPDNCRSALENQLYVDNLFLTGNSVDELKNLYTRTRKVMLCGGFELRSWASNSEELTETFAVEGTGVSHKCDHERVLGYRYFPGSDSLQLATDDDSGVSHADGGLTKRMILSKFSRVFDPLGLLLPVTVRGKIILRKLWVGGHAWDDQVPEGLQREWLDVESNISLARSISFPRQVATSGGCADIIVFCDASKEMYGCSFYVKEQGVSRLLFAKSKVAPVKSKSLPTLELLSVYLAFKCLDSVLDSLTDVKIDNLHFAVDSQIVLSWILSEQVKTKNIFARNRINDITNFRAVTLRERKLGCKFHYVPSSQNSADLLTRGLSFNNFVKNLEFWIRGPDFINNPSIDWPQSSLQCLSSESKLLTNSAINHVTEPIFDVKRYSSLNKLMRVTMLVLKFISKLRKLPVKLMQLSSTAKQYWIKTEQSSFLNEEINYLRGNTNNPSTLIKNLNVFEHDGLLRCRGRLDKCLDVSYDLSNPILLPKKSFLTKLFVNDYHLRCNHLGVSATLNGIRSAGYWIPHGRATVKSILSKCVVCRKFNSQPFKYPKPTQYIADRVNFVKPFSHTGVDHTVFCYSKVS